MFCCSARKQSETLKVSWHRPELWEQSLYEIFRNRCDHIFFPPPDVLNLRHTAETSQSFSSDPNCQLNMKIKMGVLLNAHCLLCCQGWKEHEMMGDAVFIVRECPSSSLRGDKGPITTSTLTDSVWVWGVFLVRLQQLKDFTLSHF